MSLCINADNCLKDQRTESLAPFALLWPIIVIIRPAEQARIACKEGNKSDRSCYIAAFPLPFFCSFLATVSKENGW